MIIRDYGRLVGGHQRSEGTCYEVSIWCQQPEDQSINLTEVATEVNLGNPFTSIQGNLWLKQKAIILLRTCTTNVFNMKWPLHFPTTLYCVLLCAITFTINNDYFHEQTSLVV